MEERVGLLVRDDTAGEVAAGQRRAIGKLNLIDRRAPPPARRELILYRHLVVGAAERSVTSLPLWVTTRSLLKCRGESHNVIGGVPMVILLIVSRPSPRLNT
jgi:hypothetical protein